MLDEVKDLVCHCGLRPEAAVCVGLAAASLWAFDNATLRQAERSMVSLKEYTGGKTEEVSFWWRFAEGEKNYKDTKFRTLTDIHSW